MIIQVHDYEGGIRSGSRWIREATELIQRALDERMAAREEEEEDQ